jgi:hypothetical protein
MFASLPATLGIGEIALDRGDVMLIPSIDREPPRWSLSEGGVVPLLVGASTHLPGAASRAVHASWESLASWEMLGDRGYQIYPGADDGLARCGRSGVIASSRSGPPAAGR